MRTYSLYDADGRIFSVVSLQQDLIADVVVLNHASGHIDGAVDGDIHYVRDGQIVPRLESPVMLQGLVLSRLPAPCVILINDRLYETTSETVELEFDQPGSYRVSVQAWPYLDKEFTIENPA
jgi:hypothetical protein